MLYYINLSIVYYKLKRNQVITVTLKTAQKSRLN